MKKEFKQIYLKNLVTSIAILSGIATLSMVFGYLYIKVPKATSDLKVA